MSNRRGVGINGVVGKFLKFNSWEGVEETLFDTLKLNTNKLKCFGLLPLFKKIVGTKRNNRDKIKLKEKKIDNKKFRLSAKHMKFIL